MSVRAFADDTASPEKMVERRMEHLKKALTLTDDQVGKIRPILENTAKEIKKIRDEKKGDRKAVMEAVRTQMKSADESINATLTPEQQKKFASMRESQKEKMKERMQERRAEGKASGKAEGTQK